MQAQIRFVASFRDHNHESVQRLAQRMYDLWKASRLAGDWTGTGLNSVSTPEVSYGGDLEVELGPNQVVLITVRGRVIAEIAEQQGSYTAYLGPEFEEIEADAEWPE